MALDRTKRLLPSFDAAARPKKGPLSKGAFTSKIHSERTGAVLGIALGVTFTICFLTGLLSHLVQHPPAWFEWPSRPASLYRVTQGLHVMTGLATIPLLVAKLWAVYPRLWTWPPFEDFLHLVERLSLFPLVAGGLFLLLTGLQNIYYWFPWGFDFPTAHYWASWITIGALVVHIGAKAAATARALRSGSAAVGADETGGLSRRGFISLAGATAGLVVVSTIGEIVRPLRSLAVLAPRRPDIGPQGFPVNHAARERGVESLARDPDYRLRVDGRVSRPLVLSIEELRSMPQHRAALPISCVEGWSAGVHWKGVPLRELLDAAGADAGRMVRVESLQRHGDYRSSVLNPAHARDRDTLLALEANGETLHVDHGYPVRLIAPNNPGVMQTKWVTRIVVL